MSRLFVLAIMSMLLAGRPAIGQTPVPDRLSERVDRGLAFLALLQEKDGAWLLGSERNTAVTSLAVMAFLSAGHVPGEGPYRSNVEKGIRWVLNQQQTSGLFCNAAWEDMYQHGISTLMLCEVAAMCDSKMASEIKPKLEKAVKLILQGQRTQKNIYLGGWRYKIDSNDADMSITGWQILALRAARNLGCDVPKERIDLAMQFVQQCRDPRTNGFCYMPGSQVTTACTGTGVLTLELCGKERHHSREALLGGSYLLKAPLRYTDGYFFYEAYYASQAMFQLGNNYWNVFRPQLHSVLLDNQQRNGGWLTNNYTGTSYSTSMAVLALTVEYRLLPIYQRDEDGEQPSKQK